MLQKFKRVVIRGKHGRGESVLLITQLQTHTEKQIELRNNFLKINNYYLIFKTNTNNLLTGYKVIHKYAKKCRSKNPNALTSTKLRKHLATILQVFSINDNKIVQLATFMGHPQNVNKHVYRLSDDVYQTAKIL